MNPVDKAWIDQASYEQLLEYWRNAPAGDRMFKGETGDYYDKVMKQRKEEIGHAAAVRASKNIGWDGR
jgi:hypothetical protein